MFVYMPSFRVSISCAIRSFKGKYHNFVLRVEQAYSCAEPAFARVRTTQLENRYICVFHFLSL